MKKLLIIHQSAELYGSDKTLLYFLSHYNKDLLFPIVVLPNEGPLKIELEKLNIEVHILPVMKLYRKMFEPKNALKFYREFLFAVKQLDKINNEQKIDIVYSNTLAVLLGYYYAKKRKIKHVWHVHEIIESPKLFKNAFRFYLSQKTNKLLIHNSKATNKFWNIKSSKNVVVWNGIKPFGLSSDQEIFEIRNRFFNASDEICIGLVGRISRWKGQKLLLDAFEKLSVKNENIKLIYIGSAPPNQDHFEIELKKEIVEKKLQDKVSIIPFQKNIHQFQEALDIIVVPSTEPEPFGMVAIEGMFARKPVIGANHGGLKEIVTHNETGYLFKPNDAIDLIKYLEKLINSEKIRKEFGNQGFLRANKYFSIDKYVSNLEDAILNG